MSHNPRHYVSAPCHDLTLNSDPEAPLKLLVTPFSFYSQLSDLYIIYYQYSDFLLIFIIIIIAYNPMNNLSSIPI